VRPPVTAVVAATMALMLVAGGCALGPKPPATHLLSIDDTFFDPGPNPPPADEPQAEPDDPNRSIVAQAHGAGVDIYRAPTDPQPYLTLPNPNKDGAPLVFLVRERDVSWLKVLLPVRPNGSTGWIHADQVSLASDFFRVVVELDAHRISVYERGLLAHQEPIGVGRAETPTPGGEYYLAELLQPPNPNGPYGPYAYGLSGFSDVLHNFAGGEGVIGIHGTNDPGGLGRDVSHGCIRMSNAGISKLAAILPLGTPVQILA
jgi:hypothetical protein